VWKRQKMAKPTQGTTYMLTSFVSGLLKIYIWGETGRHYVK
jgi:hypothetical protein